MNYWVLTLVLWGIVWFRMIHIYRRLMCRDVVNWEHPGSKWSRMPCIRSVIICLRIIHWGNGHRKWRPQIYIIRLNKGIVLFSCILPHDLVKLLTFGGHKISLRGTSDVTFVTGTYVLWVLLKPALFCSVLLLLFICWCLCFNTL